MDIVKFSQTVSMLKSNGKNPVIEYSTNGEVARAKFVDLDLSAFKEGFLAIVEHEGKRVRLNVIKDVVSIVPA